MGNLNSICQHLHLTRYEHLVRPALSTLVPLLLAAALAGCATKAPRPKSSSAGTDAAAAGRTGGWASNRTDPTTGPSARPGAGAAQGGAGAKAAGAGGAGQSDSNVAGDDVIRSRIDGSSPSSYDDGTGGSAAAGRNGPTSSDGSTAGAGGRSAGAAGIASEEDTTAQGAGGANAAGTNRNAPGSNADGSMGSENADGSKGAANAKGRGAGGAGDEAAGVGDAAGGAGNAAAGGGGPQAGGRRNGAAGASDMAGAGTGADSEQGANAGDAARRQGAGAGGPGAGRDNAGGVGVGEAGVEEDDRIAAIEVPSSNVKVDEEFRPQTLGGMLPLVLGVNEEGRFDFDQYALRDDVKGVLDDLADKLKTAEFDRLDVYGYTDRIGTSQYNQRLSELRAWAVAQYLIHKGIPDNKVYYEGRGQTDPLTQPGECSGLAREELITCLQKDRRVEIEASIRRKHATVTQ